MMTDKEKWLKYEEEKAKLRQQNLSEKEYEEAIKKLTVELEL